MTVCHGKREFPCAPDKDACCDDSKRFCMSDKIKDRHAAEGEELTVFMAPSKKLQVICVVVIIP